MTTIKVDQTWQEVTEIQPDDYVIAGPNQGINIQLGQLAGRDEFLKNLIEVTKQQIFSELAKQGQLNKILCPPGAMISYAGQTAPDGWLICDGSRLKKSLYPELYAAIGDLYGADETTFNLPDSRYRYSRAAGPTLPVGTKQEDTIKSHSHNQATWCGLGNGYASTSAEGGTNYEVPSSKQIYNGTEYYIKKYDYWPEVPVSETGDEETRPLTNVDLRIIKY